MFSVDGKVISSINNGLCVLVGIGRKDAPKEAEWLWVYIVLKIVNRYQIVKFIENEINWWYKLCLNSDHWVKVDPAWGGDLCLYRLIFRNHKIWNKIIFYVKWPTGSLTYNFYLSNITLNYDIWYTVRSKT